MPGENAPPFSEPLNWNEKIFQADVIWQQVKAALAQTGTNLDPMLRRPDVRMIINNISGAPVIFQNPGQHGDKKENVPSEGDKTAAMVMVAGETLSDQHLNAFEMFNRFALGERGLTEEFVTYIQTPDAREFITEAYGPAPFDTQAKKLVHVEWTPLGRKMTAITPIFTEACAFGARAATTENAFVATLHVYVQGTTTSPELMENKGMVIAVSPNDGKDTTRPIVPSVATGFYGDHFNRIPIVLVSDVGHVQSIDLRDGNIIALDRRGGAARLMPRAESPHPMGILA